MVELNTRTVLQLRLVEIMQTSFCTYIIVQGRPGTRVKHHIPKRVMFLTISPMVRCSD